MRLQEEIEKAYKLTAKEKDDATKRIDNRIAELHRQEEENSSHNTDNGNLAEPLSDGKYSPTNVGVQGENSRTTKLPKGFKSAGDIAEKLSNFILGLRSRNDVTADNFTKKLVESICSIHNGVWYMYTVDKDRNIVLHDAISAEKGRYEEYKQKLRDFYGIDGSAKDIYSYLREREYRTGDNADLLEYFQSGGNSRNRGLGEHVDDVEKQGRDISGGTAERMLESGVGENTKSEGKGKRLRFFRTSDGEIYGFAVDGKIGYDSRIAGAETLHSTRIEKHQIVVCRKRNKARMPIYLMLPMLQM